MRRRFSFLILAYCLFAAAGSGGAIESVRLPITTPSGDVMLTVEIADDSFEHAQGLMHREDLPLSHGMLFVFADDARRHFWMKDTPLSLDLLFFDSGGDYIGGHFGTEPYSLRSLSSDRPARYALEVRSGEAVRLGLGEGSRLQLPLP
jgi:uncharacterized membrane protein (UPF0127 family)